MWRLNHALGRLFEALLAPLQSLPPFWVLVLLSAPTAILMLLVFRYASDQEGIRRTKKRIKAHLLEIPIFKDDAGIQLSALKGLLAQNLHYLRLSLAPLLVAVLPLAAIVLQLDAWFGYRPLKAGERAVISVTSSGEKTLPLSEITLLESAGVTVETPPVRIPGRRETAWRIRGDESGLRALTVRVRGKAVEKRLRVSDRLLRVSRHRVAPRLPDLIFHAAERPIPAGLGLERISVDYPSRSIAFLGWRGHWIVVYVVASLIFGFTLKGLFRVEL